MGNNNVHFPLEPLYFIQRKSGLNFTLREITVKPGSVNQYSPLARIRKVEWPIQAIKSSSDISSIRCFRFGCIVALKLFSSSAYLSFEENFHLRSLPIPLRSIWIQGLKNAPSLKWEHRALPGRYWLVRFLHSASSKTGALIMHPDKKKMAIMKLSNTSPYLNGTVPFRLSF